MFELDTFIADCRAALGESTPEAAVRELVERAVAQLSLPLSPSRCSEDRLQTFICRIGSFSAKGTERWPI